MSVIEVDFPGNIAQVANATALRALPSSSIADNALYLVSDLGLYTYDAGSLASDNGTTALKPADLTSLQAGRWALSGSGIFDANVRTDLAQPNGASNVGFDQLEASTVNQDIQSKVYQTLDVLDFASSADKTAIFGGNKGIDLAYAYNLAIKAAAAYDSDPTTSVIFCTVMAPRFTHCVKSPVWVRRGVSLVGPGYGAVINLTGASGAAVFNLGMKSDGTTDAGGAPSEIRNFRTYSGPSGGAVVKVKQPGARISNMFMTSVDDGILIEDSSDVVMSDVTVDQGTVGIRLKGSTGSGSRNLTISNLITFSASYSVLLDGNVFDIAVSNFVFAYPKTAAVFFNDGSFHMRGIRFSTGHIVVNQQGGAFTGMMACFRSRGNDVELRVNGVSCRNFKGYGVLHDNGIGFDAVFDACEFNGQSTDQTNYADPTTTAKVYMNGTGDRVAFNNCTLANLPAQPFETTGSTALNLTVSNCRSYGNVASSFLLHGNTATTTRVLLKDNEGDGAQLLYSGSGTSPLYVKADSNAGFNGGGTVASAATITVPKRTDVIQITGTAGVSGFTTDATNAGRRVTFVLGASQTWTDGGNLRLNGDFSGTIDDTITLATGDGLTWYEVSRCPN